MKITFTPAIKYEQNINNRIRNNVTTSNANVQGLPKHSLSEVLGRVLLSFKGLNTQNGDIVEHTCTEKTSLNDYIKERIIFNRKTGVYTHIVTDKNDGFIRSENYYPQKGMQVISEMDEEGINTTTTSTDNYTTVEKLDSENRQIYLQHTEGDVIRLEETDYERGRKVVHVTEQGVEQPVVVFDINTNDIVTSGDLVIDTRYDEYLDTYITENIVTGVIHKKEKFDSDANVIFSIEYNPETGSILKERRFDDESCGFLEDTYTGAKENKLVSSLFVSKDGREKEMVLYAEDGETIVSHTVYLYRENGTPQKETIYNGSNVVTEKIIYGKGKSKTHYFFNEETGKPKSSKKYNKKGVFVSETLYYEDGKTPKRKRQLDKEGGFSTFSFNEEGVKTKRNKYNKDKKPVLTEFFDVNTKLLEKTIEINYENGEKTITIYDEDYELPYKETILDKNNIVICQTIYYEDGETPQYIKEYNDDRSYRVTEFDDAGYEIAHQDYNADGTKKTVNV